MASRRDLESAPASIGKSTARESAALGRAEFTSVVEHIKDYAVYLLDIDGKAATWNLGAERLTGYSADEIIGHHLSCFYTPEDIESGLPARALNTAREEGRFEDEGWRVRKDGSKFWADVVVTPVLGHDGEIAGFVKLTRDLTERKVATENLRQSRERSRLLIEGLKDYAIFYVDLQGRVGSWNSGAERLFGYPTTEIVGRHFSIFYPPEEIENGRPQRDAESSALEWRVEYEGWRVRTDGSRFWAEIAMWLLYDDSGQTIGSLHTIKDLTERNRAQEERALRHAAEAALRERDDFLSMASHELRSPLAALKLLVQITRDEVVAGNVERILDKLPDRLERVQRQADRIDALINRLMSISIIAGGRLVLDSRPLDLSKIVADVVADLKEVAQQARCQI